MSSGSTPKSDMSGIYNVIKSCQKIEQNKYVESNLRDLEVVIPTYQRGYSWDKQNFFDFIEMLESLTASSNVVEMKFMGQMIFHIDNSNTIEVVDGQQRLTSFLIFAKILYEFWEDQEEGSYNVDYKDVLKSYLYINEKPRFKHQLNNRNIIYQFIYLLEPATDSVDDVKEAYNRYTNGEINKEEYRHELKKIYLKTKAIKKDYFHSIIMGYEEIKKFCDEKLFVDERKNINDLNNLTNNLLTNEGCKVMVSILVFEAFNTAYEAFMSINSKGKDLTTYDLIRSEFIGNIDKDKYTEIEKNWDQKIDRDGLTATKLVEIFDVMLKIKYKKEYYDFKKQSGGKSKKTILYDALSYFRKNDIVNINEMYEEYKKFISNYCMMLDGKFSDIMSSSSYKEFNIIVKRTLEMNYLPFQPLLFEILENKSNEKFKDKLWIERVVNVIRYVPFIYVTVCKMRPSHLTDSMDKYLRVNSKYSLDDIISDTLGGNVKDVFCTSFCGTVIKDTKIAKDILLLIEDRRDADKYSNHLEHIYPQKNNPSQWDKSLEKEHIYNIGNQVIAPDRLNNTMGNKRFDEKMNAIAEYSKDAPITDYRFLNELLVEYQTDKIEYNLENINTRSKKYLEELLSRFKEMKLFKD